MKYAILLTVVTLMAVSPMSGGAVTITIPDDVSTIQEGINASAHGDTVLVLPGTYPESLDFLGKSIVLGSLFLTTADTSYVSKTIIGGDENEGVVTVENITGTPAEISGLTLLNTGLKCEYSELNVNHVTITQYGGTGFDSRDSTINMDGVLISECGEGLGGGGGIRFGTCQLTVTNSRITGINGGSVALFECEVDFSDVTIDNNNANHIAGMQLVSTEGHFADMKIHNNRATSVASSGAGIYCSGSSPVFENIHLKDNLSGVHENEAAGVYCTNNSNPVFKNCHFENTGRECGLYCRNSSPTVINSIFRNQLLWFSENSKPELHHVTIIDSHINIWENSHPVFVNSIILTKEGRAGIDFKHPMSSGYSDPNSSISVSHALVENVYPEEFMQSVTYLGGNIIGSPQFVDAENGDLSLRDSSPCIGAGISLETVKTDYMNNPRGGIPDIGAYESTLDTSDYSSGGHVKLSGQIRLAGMDDHSGVILILRSADGFDRSRIVYTDITGNFTVYLEKGSFDLSCKKPGYMPEFVSGINMDHDVSLPELTLAILKELIHVPEDIGSIQAAINIASDGTTILVAPGTYTEGIDYKGKAITVASWYVTTQDTSYISKTIIDTDFKSPGVTFKSGEDSLSVLDGLTIAHCSGNEFNNYLPDCGIICSYSSPTLKNIRVQECDGLGIGLYESSMTIQNAVINGNTKRGVYASHSNVIITNAIIINNGGGVASSSNSTMTLSNAIVAHNNLPQNEGSAVSCGFESTLDCINVTFYDNHSYYYCFYVGEGKLLLNNCIIANNTCHDFLTSISDHIPVNSQVPIMKSLFWNNTTPYGKPLKICDTKLFKILTIDRENKNGDPTDKYYNMLLEPAFVDAENDDFNLLPGSPAIDAGEKFKMPMFDINGVPRDDVPDIGAYEFVPETILVDKDNSLIPQKLLLHQNIPNPFNATTMITFDLSSPAFVTVSIYDVTGRKAARICDGHYRVGKHSVRFDGDGLSSGMYFYRAEADGFVVSGKMTLIK